MPVIAAAMLAHIGSADRAQAETGEVPCIAAIHAAAAHPRGHMVPPDCWRLGPLTLGMTRKQAEELMGAPDQSAPRTLRYRRHAVLVDTALYVFPRNLGDWLRLVPVAAADFHPVSLRLVYFQGALAALDFGLAARIDAPACKAVARGRVLRRTGGEELFRFLGVGLGTKLSQVNILFGRFRIRNASRDFGSYAPLPLAFDGEDTVEAIALAGEMFAGAMPMPHFAATLDPDTCFINGYRLVADPIAGK